MSEGEALPVLILDGSTFRTFDEFVLAFSRLLDDWVWDGNLNAFNDILRGGFGTPEDGFVLRWLHSNKSRRVLGEYRFATIVEIIRDHGPGGDEAEDNVHLELL